MKKSLSNYGGIILFYLAIIFCIILVNARFNYLNTTKNISSTYAYNN